MGKPTMYILQRLKSRSSDIVVCWTGESSRPWSECSDDAVLFRSKVAAEDVARAKRWPVRQPGEWHENPMAVEASEADLLVTNFDFTVR